MLSSFRRHHLNQLFAEYRDGGRPLDRVVAEYFRTHRALGAKDRQILGEILFRTVRWGVMFEELGEDIDPWQASANKNLPPHIRCGCPQAAFSCLTHSLGHEAALALGLVSNETAPTTVRVNTVKTTRAVLLSRWTKWEARACKLSDVGIVLPRRLPLMALPEFREGWFELQDEASQLIAQQVAAKPGDLILDFCAGAGGKSLAIGQNLAGCGVLYLHDIRQGVLRNARRRLARAGLHQVQFLLPGDRRLKGLRKRMDWVLVDAPCSGTGTWRRNVDMKWRFDQAALARFVQTQREILAQAKEYLSPQGRLVYSTCSVLPEENGQQLEFAERELGLRLVQEPFCSWPTTGGMDGVFAAVLAA